MPRRILRCPQFAQALDDTNDSAMLLQHAQNWKNHFNPASGYLRCAGGTVPGAGFTNNAEFYDQDRAYVEGTAGTIFVDGAVQRERVDGPDGWAGSCGQAPGCILHQVERRRTATGFVDGLVG